MATVTRLGQDQSIRERIDRLNEMRIIVTGQVADLKATLDEREAHLARIEGGIVELQALLAPLPQPETVEAEPVPEEE